MIKSNLKARRTLAAIAVGTALMLSAPSVMAASKINGSLSGQVSVQSGTSLENVQVKVKHESKGLVRSTISDDKGNFSIPAYEEILNLGKLAQFVGKILLIVELDGEEIAIWVVAKFDGETYSDLAGPLDELVCDLDSERLSLDMPRSMISTRCRWQGMPEFK